MRVVGQKDTACELAVRKIVHARGLRYRVDHPLPFDHRRRADLLFPRQRVAVFIDVCFLHGCPEHGTSAKSNADWWRRKIAPNRARDRDTGERLVAIRWLALRFWEHGAPGEVGDVMGGSVRGRKSGRGIGFVAVSWPALRSASHGVLGHASRSQRRFRSHLAESWTCHRSLLSSGRHENRNQHGHSS
ncbi:MAG: hypothetical protein P1V81_12265, partial [Planctomycetota bacterium]|nr:hypothetical protein [Planctomycetota bacterium]